MDRTRKCFLASRLSQVTYVAGPRRKSGWFRLPGLSDEAAAAPLRPGTEPVRWWWC
jgi:hypothetical protein